MPDWMDRADEFTTSSFPYVRGAQLAATLVGIIALAIFEGIADLIETLYDELLIVPLTALAEYLETVVLTPFLGGNAPGRDGGPPGMVATLESAFASLYWFIVGLGPAALGFTVLVVLAVAYVVTQGVKAYGS